MSKEKSTQKIRELILDELKGNPSNTKLHDLDDKKLGALIFKRHTVRLTYTGYKYLSKVADNYVYRHDNDFRPKHIIALAELKFPYYLSTKFFVLFSDEDALLVSLHGDVSKFLENSYIFRKRG